MIDGLSPAPSSAKAPQRAAPVSGLTAVRLSSYQGLEDIRTEWAELVRDAGLGSPFVHPGWSLTWARQFVREDDLEYVAIRGGGPEGPLVGMGPFYRRRRSLGALGVTTVQPIGTGHGDPLTEGVHILARPEHSREVLRAVIEHVTLLPDTHWVQVSVGDGQGWPLPQWVDGDVDALITHRKTRACVIIEDLPTDPKGVLPGLRRNLRESLRRARNRSAKLSDMAFRCVSDPEAVTTAVGQLIRLHTLRAAMPGKVRHPNLLAGAFGEFLCEAVVQLARDGLASVHLAENAGRPVAAQLVLSDGTVDYISVSGLDPNYWDYNLNTMLIFKAVQTAVVDGRNAVNLSAGPNIAKMRWSSKVITHHDFDIVPRGRRAQLLHEAYVHAALAKENHQERRRHRTLGGPRPRWEMARSTRVKTLNENDNGGRHGTR